VYYCNKVAGFRVERLVIGIIKRKISRLVVKGILEKRVWLPYFGAGFCPETEQNR